MEAFLGPVGRFGPDWVSEKADAFGAGGFPARGLAWEFGTRACPFFDGVFCAGAMAVVACLFRRRIAAGCVPRQREIEKLRIRLS